MQWSGEGGGCGGRRRDRANGGKYEVINSDETLRESTVRCEGGLAAGGSSPKKKGTETRYKGGNWGKMRHRVEMPRPVVVLVKEGPSSTSRKKDT